MSFKTNTHFTRHKINRHSNIYRYECSICQARFKASTGLKLHMASHKDPEFKCFQCFKKFTRKESLKIHVRAVHEGQKFLCKNCNKEFARKEALKKHENVFHRNLKIIL